jgi:hypothetical protein
MVSSPGDALIDRAIADDSLRCAVSASPSGSRIRNNVAASHETVVEGALRPIWMTLDWRPGTTVRLRSDSPWIEHDEGAPRGDIMRDEADLDELGPVDWIVVEFPGSKFNGEIAPALNDLVERDLIQVLDLLFMRKDSDGTLEAFEISDLDEAEVGGFRSHEQELAMLLSEEDVNAVAAAIEPGSSAAVLVWENKWAAHFGAAVRHAGGQLVASGRIPVQAMLAAIEASDDADETEEA